MARGEVSLKGGKRRKSSGRNYFEARFSGHGKLFCSKIKSREEGALCYDILQRYIELEGSGKKRNVVKLNYQEYSRTLKLKPLPRDFRNDEAMEIILEQARAAAKNLPESERRTTLAVGSPSPSNRSSSHQNVHGNPLVVKQDLPGVCTNQLNLQEISELSHHCNMSYTSKVIEREMLERKVADINEDAGIISVPQPDPNEFSSFMARFKQLIAIDEKIPGILEKVEQGYKSEDSKCSELRKLLEVHNFKVIESSTDDGNKTSGRQRANEDERPPRVLENFPFEEQNECAVSVLGSCGLPGNPLIDVGSSGTDTTTPPVEIGLSQRVLPHEFDEVADENAVTRETFSLNFPARIGPEEENGSLPGVWNGCDPQMPFSQWNSEDRTALPNPEFNYEYLDWLISPPVTSTDIPSVQLQMGGTPVSYFG